MSKLLMNQLAATNMVYSLSPLAIFSIPWTVWASIGWNCMDAARIFIFTTGTKTPPPP